MERQKTIFFVGSIVVMFFLLVSPDNFPQFITADMGGRIINQQNEPLSNVNLILISNETGIQRGTASGANGVYRISALEPGTYKMKCSHIGYSTKIFDNIELSVGQTLNWDIQLELQSVTFTDSIIVIGSASLIERTISDRRSVFGDLEINNLPTNVRTGYDLAFLSPGVNRSYGTGYSPFNIGAYNDRDVRLFVDGIDFSSFSVGGLPAFSILLPQSSISQFEVTTNLFKPEYGNSPSGFLNQVTKSGSNEFHGTAFGFIRDASLDEKNYFSADKPSYSRQQYGFSLGGPILKDRTHFFIAFERFFEGNDVTINTGGIFPELEGTFISPYRHNNLFIKLNHKLSSNYFLMSNFNYLHASTEIGWGGNTIRSAGAEVRPEIFSTQISHKWIINEKLLNTLRIAYYNDFEIVDPITDGSQLRYPSVTLGGNIFGDQELTDSRLEVKSDLYYHLNDFAGEHNWKGGFDIMRYHSSGFGDIYYNGLFYFETDTSSAPNYGIVGDGNSHWSFVNYKLGFYIQDDWIPTENLTLNIGLRYDIETNVSNQNFAPQLNDLDLQPFLTKGNRPIDTDNFGPRLGVTWEPFCDKSTIIRGGYGIFYGNLTAQFGFEELLLGKYPIYAIPNPAATDRNKINFEGLSYDLGWILPEKVPMPYSQKFLIGLSKDFNNEFAVDIDFIRIRGFNQPFALNDINPVDPNNQSRPIPKYNEIWRVRTDGKTFYDAMEIVIRKRFINNYLFRITYTLAKTVNYFDDYKYSGKVFQKGPSISDERHRLTLSGIVTLPFEFQLSGIAIISSGRPYSIYTGDDDNHNGDLTDDFPESVGRNSERADGYFNVDLRLSKLFELSNYHIELIVDAFNIFNSTNYNPSSYVGNQKSGVFKEPTSALAPRGVQFGIRFSF